MSGSTSRRNFLQVLGIAGAAGAVPLVSVASARPAEAVAAPSGSASILVDGKLPPFKFSLASQKPVVYP